jgi:hypothetical protein
MVCREHLFKKKQRQLLSKYVVPILSRIYADFLLKLLAYDQKKQIEQLALSNQRFERLVERLTQHCSFLNNQLSKVDRIPELSPSDKPMIDEIYRVKDSG